MVLAWASDFFQKKKDIRGSNTEPPLLIPATKKSSLVINKLERIRQDTFVKSNFLEWYENIRDWLPSPSIVPVWNWSNHKCEFACMYERDSNTV